MGDVAIDVQQLGKQYRIGTPQTGYGTLRDAMASAVRAPLRGLRSRNSGNASGALWALRDVTFNVEHGEVLGVIGRNGAGKSTLLKLLSRVTRPTTGRAEIHGRVGSLLEVGTGFHPELSGRENIYLNGAILGMTRADIDRNFDAIVQFAEIERFLDTPVKRYSTGMYMRLAFSVAAHLEPDILVVDEVLAVGDASFQKKCLGKMDSVAREGRTVLLVSHNMPTILSLCNRVLLLRGGRLVSEGAPHAVVQEYLESALRMSTTPLDQRADRSGDGSARITGFQIMSMDPDGVIRSGSRLKIVVTYRSEAPLQHPQFVVSINDHMDVGIFVLHNEMGGGLPSTLPPQGSVTCVTDPINLTPGRCVVHLELLKGNVRADLVPTAAWFEVEADNSSGAGILPTRNWAMCLLPHVWTATTD